MVAEHPEPRAATEGGALVTRRPVAKICAHCGLTAREPLLAVDLRSGREAPLCLKCQLRLERGYRPMPSLYEIKEATR